MPIQTAMVSGFVQKSVFRPNMIQHFLIAESTFQLPQNPMMSVKNELPLSHRTV